MVSENGRSPSRHHGCFNTKSWPNDLDLLGYPHFRTPHIWIKILMDVCCLYVISIGFISSQCPVFGSQTQNLK